MEELLARMQATVEGTSDSALMNNVDDSGPMLTDEDPYTQEVVKMLNAVRSIMLQNESNKVNRKRKEINKNVKSYSKNNKDVTDHSCIHKRKWKNKIQRRCKTGT